MSESAWQEVHDRMLKVAGAKAALDEEQGRLMLDALRADVHSHLGYATFIEYIERMFGYGPRETGERLRIARRSKNCRSYRKRFARRGCVGRRCASSVAWPLPKASMHGLRRLREKPCARSKDW